MCVQIQSEILWISFSSFSRSHYICRTTFSYSIPPKNFTMCAINLILVPIVWNQTRWTWYRFCYIRIRVLYMNRQNKWATEFDEPDVFARLHHLLPLRTEGTIFLNDFISQRLRCEWILTGFINYIYDFNFNAFNSSERQHCRHFDSHRKMSDENALMGKTSAVPKIEHLSPLGIMYCLFNQQPNRCTYISFQLWTRNVYRRGENWRECECVHATAKTTCRRWNLIFR